MKIIKQLFYSLWLWIYRRDEWSVVSKRFIGKRRIDPEYSKLYDLFEYKYVHEKTGFIRKLKYYN